MNTKNILYCHCAYARVIPKETKEEVLRKLSDANINFQAVPDLCQWSAEKEPGLREISEKGNLQIVACYPRAVKWLFRAAETPLNEQTTEILNMRADEPDVIVKKCLETNVE